MIAKFSETQLIPAKKFQFLGELYDLKLALVYPTEQLLVKISSKLNIFQNAHTISARQWMSYRTITGNNRSGASQSTTVASSSMGYKKQLELVAKSSTRELKTSVFSMWEY